MWRAAENSVERPASAVVQCQPFQVLNTVPRSDALAASTLDKGTNPFLVRAQLSFKPYPHTGAVSRPTRKLRVPSPVLETEAVLSIADQDLPTNVRTEALKIQRMPCIGKLVPDIQCLERPLENPRFFL